MQETQKTFQLMEWHRGEFIPVKSTDAQGKKGEVKYARITQSSADELNRDFDTERGKGTKFKYVEVDDKAIKKQPVKQSDAPMGPGTQKPDDDELKRWRTIYEEKIGKRPYHAWTVEQLMDKIDNN